MTVLLHRDPTDDERVLELPAFVIPRSPDRYVHQPRSAVIVERPKWPELNGLYVHLWCGQSRRQVKATELTDHEPGPGLLSCGTCIGRRRGFDRSDGTVFRPRDIFALPARCPGGDDGTSHCLSCGRKVRYGYSWSGGFQGSHRPEPALLERWQPCAYHGWLFMYAREDLQLLVCSSFRCPTWPEGRRW